MTITQDGCTNLPTKTESIDSKDLEAVRKALISMIGERVDFSNGCTVFLIDDNGIYWGTNPYGIDRGWDVNEHYISNVIKWLEYWNEARDEQGRMLF
ncbi:hypothetical protein [Aeromonas hydrophila]|uniref:hypothetical protein n=1 Tax=Aeromonas hydrophila TaxID=644 RepID=UPI002253DE04|nr:hypothetical protein [Aeromonas hydrophila]MCX4117206.1 hypothetical protein [Aeromonas hydrophila]